MNIFSTMNWGGSIPVWKEVSRRKFTEEELKQCDSSKGEVVAGQYSFILKVTLAKRVNGKEQFVLIPITPESEVNSGDKVDLRNCVLITLYHSYDKVSIIKVHVSTK